MNAIAEATRPPKPSSRSFDPGEFLDAETFESRLRRIGAERYHNLHPFHKLLHSGGCSHAQVQAWVLNRFYYQSRIPLKDASLLSRAEDLDLRREWRQRIEDHDGHAGNEGGIERWFVLAEAVGLDRDYVASTEGILPATKFAVEAYVRFVREKSLLEAVASSLTELFAPKIHEERIAGLLEHYDFANDRTIAYFTNRLNEAPKDVKFGLAYVIREARTREQQEQVMAALRFKTDVLWAQLDALYHAYVAPGHIPPGAFVPDGHSGEVHHRVGAVADAKP
ncbi:pyrroloquinoline-quinone synthase PqqC [Denitrobaculum tricleocarpae]|uniref:Pyrroloquinoline-quinone synthase n=1 Tax=Denitrobaculum tricleocarpae TaxID=2591009 RepID=A0A545U0V1_9PROT|nr:pyrroloquinoline-quinone synthase PqqC [Denitrobaculum tricleocarpae]TQV83088.1 pyrroloquinoline-quinone synthase PqqC [Denitrobaculum tricleocarpae]